jgi:hypothetical protein
MTDDERNDELAAESIEDLEAPAAAQGDVAGGAMCADPTCVGGTKVEVYCELPTCRGTSQICLRNTASLIVNLR